MFKIALMDRWLVVVNGTRLVDELQKFPDEYVSASEAIGEVSAGILGFDNSDLMECQAVKHQLHSRTQSAGDRA